MSYVINCLSVSFNIPKICAASSAVSRPAFEMYLIGDESMIVLKNE